MPDKTRPKKKRPDFYFNGDIHWYEGDAFLAVQSGTAHGLYWAALAWTRGRLEDGFVPDAVIGMLAACVKADPERDRAELVRAGLWAKAKGGIRIPDYDDWNDTRADVEARKGKARRAINERWKAVRDTRGNTPSIPDVIQRTENSDSDNDNDSSSKSLDVEPARDADARVDEYERRIAEAQRAHDEAYRPAHDPDEPF